MNHIILELAATYVNRYISSTKRRGFAFDDRAKETLREHVRNRFGEVYAAILIQ